MVRHTLAEAVLLNVGVYLSGTIVLRAKVTLKIEADAVLRGRNLAIPPALWLFDIAAAVCTRRACISSRRHTTTLVWIRNLPPCGMASVS